MYAMRADPERRELRIDFTGRLTHEEALRAVTQGFALVDAGALTTALCDLRDVERGPGGLLPIAAALAVRFRPGLKVAFIAEEEQLPYVRRLQRFSGIGRELGVFEAEEAARAWLTAEAPRRARATTEQRHVEHLAASQPTRRRGDGRSARITGPAA